MPSVPELEKEINIPLENAPMFELDLCTFVFGLADVAGEVMRFTTSSIDSDTIDNSLKFMRQMYDVFISIQEKAGVVYFVKPIVMTCHNIDNLIRI